MPDVVAGEAIENGLPTFGGEKAKDHVRAVEARKRDLEDRAAGLRTLADPFSVEGEGPVPGRV